MRQQLSPIPSHCRAARVAVAIAIAAAVAASGCRRSADKQQKRSFDAVFALEDIPEWTVALDADGLAKLRKKPKKFVRGEFRWGKLHVPAAIRLKGNRSMRKFDGKSAFKIRFDKYTPDNELLGRRSLTLNNLVEDPTMVREILGYRVMRAMGVPAPEVGFAFVTVNNLPFGLYAVVESVDEQFLAKHFDDPSGNLYEGEYGCDMFPDDVAGFDKDAGEVESRDDLAALAAAAWPAEDAAHRLVYADDAPLDREAFLSYLAVSAFIGDFDGYRHSHNYRIYHEPTLGKWTFIPWGYDRVLRKRLDIYDSQGLLAKICFRDARCRADYLRKLREVADKFETLELEQAVDVVLTVIADAEERDSRKPHEQSKIRAERAKLRAFIAERPDEVRAQLGCLDPDGVEIDGDGDGHACTDCNDGDPAIHPGAEELCDGVDNDCSGVVDDSPACPCPVVEIEGARFALCDRPMPWVEAEAFCAAMGEGVSLARIDSKKQSRRLRRAANKHSKDRWWIGLSDREEEDEFQWSDGTPVTFTFWNRGEPDNDSCNQDCAALKDKTKRKRRGRWHDTHCGQHRPFVCRLPPLAAP